MKTSGSKNAVIYCRVSTKEQVEEGNSLVTQERICREYAAKHSYTVTGVFIEQGESAKTANRTQLKALLSFCKDKRNNISVVIAYKIDRISRNTDDYSNIRIELRAYGVEIKSTSEQFEHSPVGRFLENTMASIAQFDNDVRTERSVNGMKEAIREGRYVWTAPIGYDNVKIGDKSTIAINEVTAPFVLKSFTLVATNTRPIQSIYKQMIEEGFCLNSGKPVSQSNFYAMLTNRLYTGTFIKFGEKHIGSFEPIVSEQLFEHVQRILKGKGQRQIQHLTDNPDFPLRRFVISPEGKKLTGCWSKGRTKKYPMYYFPGKGKCYNRDFLEQKFREFMDSFSLPDDDFAFLKQRVKKHFDKRTESEQKEIKRIENYLHELQTKQSVLVDKNIQGIITDTLLARELEKIETELTKTQARLAQIDLKMNKGITVGEALNKVRQYLQNPSEIWLEAKLERKLLLQWFEFPKGVMFDGERFRTAEISRFFQVKNLISEINSSTVPSGSKTLNTPKVPAPLENIPYNKEFWEDWKYDLYNAYHLLKEESP